MLEEKEKYLLSVERYRYRVRINVQYRIGHIFYRIGHYVLPTTRISFESFKTFIDTDKWFR
jgi:hypothetical protein